MAAHSQIDYLIEIAFGWSDNILGTSKSVALPFAATPLLSRASSFGLMRKNGWLSMGSSPLAASVASAVISIAVFFDVYFKVVNHDEMRNVSFVFILFFFTLLYASIFLAPTPLLTVNVGAARRPVASPVLIVGSACACLNLQSPWFNYLGRA
jgi:hypothetical protein